MNIDAVQQRPTDPTQIAFDLQRRAVAIAFRITTKPARAWIHRRDQHHTRRKRHASHGPRNCHVLIFQRLTQDFQCSPIEFRQLIQEQNPVVRQTDLTRLWNASTTDQSGFADRVMR